MGAFVLFNLQNQPAGGAASPAGVTGSQSAAGVIQRGPYRSVIADRIPEGTSPTISLVITDDDGEDLTPDDLAFAKLTLKRHGTATIINNRNAQDIKVPESGVTIELYGEAPKSVKITFPMTPADTPMIGTEARETHEALFHWALKETDLEDKHQVLHTIRKL